MTYHKIEGPFMRSEDLKTVDRTKWRNPVVEMLADTPIWVASETYCIVNAISQHEPLRIA